MGAAAQVRIKRVLLNDSGVSVEVIRSPVGPVIGFVRSTSKTYISILESPWAALLALAGLVIFICLIGVIIICFTWAR